MQIDEERLEDEPVEGEAEVLGAISEEDSGDEEAVAEAVLGPRLILKRNGAETDVVFNVSTNAIVGRFDPLVGPIDVDLGSIPEGSFVSRKHARIFEEDGVWSIEDLGSSNGTFILRDDFEKIDRADLEDGSEVAFGNARFVFRLGAG